MAGWVRNSSLLLTLVDVGGQISNENRLIMSEATHAIILSRNGEQIDEWRELCGSIKTRPLQVIAELVSNLEGESDRFKITDHLLKGEICGINRGVDLSEREIVKAIALQLVGLVKSMERRIS